VTDHLRVQVNGRPVGRLGRHGRGSSFVYASDARPEDAVSLTMPVRTASYDTPTGMLPVFEMNMPEGEILARVRRALAKDDRGRVDPFDILSLTGSNQVGRVRLLPETETTPPRSEGKETVEWLLRQKSNSGPIRDMIDRYAPRSGVSGAMPKILMPENPPENRSGRMTLRTGKWIIKFDADDYPGVSLNEYHCLRAAKAAGNQTVDARLSREGKTLVIRRFDSNGETATGFEDFASLNAKTSDRKYEGSVETALVKASAAFGGRQTRTILAGLFRQVVTSVALRNGDAHLKNYGLLYGDSVNGPFRLTPAFDIVTTRAFDDLRRDPMALTLNGTKRWPKPEALRALGTRCRLRPRETSDIIDEVAGGIAASIPGMVEHLSDHGHGELAARIAREWAGGLSESLGRDTRAPDVRQGET